MIRGEAASRAVETRELQQLVTDRGEVSPRAGLGISEVRGGRWIRRGAGIVRAVPPSSVASGSMSGEGSMSGPGR